MLFTRTLTEKDINATRLGKLRAYSLTRNSQAVHFKGKLLGYYSVSGDCLEPAAQYQTHLESIAIFKTQTRYLVYYIIRRPDNEHAMRRQVSIHAAPTLDHLAAFIDSMHYANKKAFAHAVIDDARTQDK